MESLNTFNKRMQQKVSLWKDEVESIKRQANVIHNNSQNNQKLNYILELQEVAYKKLMELQDNSGDSWQDLYHQTQEEWQDLENKITDAIEIFKE